jgi:hypothetical protein
MFEDAVRVSEALRLAAAEASFRPLMPALAGCRACGTAEMIAAPALGTCLACGAELVVLDRTYGERRDAQALSAAA